MKWAAGRGIYPEVWSWFELEPAKLLIAKTAHYKLAVCSDLTLCQAIIVQAKNFHAVSLPRAI